MEHSSSPALLGSADHWSPFVSWGRAEASAAEAVTTGCYPLPEQLVSGTTSEGARGCSCALELEQQVNEYESNFDLIKKMRFLT